MNNKLTTLFDSLRLCEWPRYSTQDPATRPHFHHNETGLS